MAIPNSIRRAYDSALAQHPNSPVLWLSYAQYESRLHNYSELETIFGRHLRQSLDISFWMLYLRHVRWIAATESPVGDEGVIEAYELAVNQVGLDYEAGCIWNEYIHLLKSRTGSGLLEQQQLMEAVRKAYHRTLQIPVQGLEALWNDYEAWEMQLNKLTAKKFMSDKSPQYVQARTCSKELADMISNLDRHSLYSSPFDAWNQWFSWERSNPLRTNDAMLHSRIVFAFKQGITHLVHVPEVWQAYTSYLLSIDKFEEALSIVNEGHAILPNSPVVAFAYADVLDAIGAEDRVVKCRAVFEPLLDHLEGMPHPDPSIIHDLGLVYIQFMDFLRRNESIGAARSLFSRARKCPHCHYSVFIASARLEYFCKKDAQVATKIFELGMTRFGGEGEYVAEYLNFLIQMNDDQNTRALFERAVQSLDPEMALSIWKQYLGFEAKFGDRGTLRELERRMRAAYPDTPETTDASFFYNRHSFGSLQPKGSDDGSQGSRKDSWSTPKTVCDA